MPTKVLVFESDDTFAAALRDGLERHACRVTVVDDAAAGLAQAAAEKPDLILLSIELPRMNGFSVCNKLKRDGSLADVPLIIMSADSTEETFEQHRRLRTRAEDYVHKPVSFEDLLDHIRQYVALNSTDPGSGASVSVVPESEIVLEHDEELVDIEMASIAPRSFRGASEPPPSVDTDVESFTEQAFGALVDEPGRTSSLPPPESLGEGTSGAPRSSVRSGSLGSGRPSQSPSQAPERLMAQVDALRASLREAEQRADAAEAQIKAAESEVRDVERLQKELGELKEKLASGKNVGSAREFLDLREQLYKKDKEILDVRDQLSHKEKELLALREGSLALERDKADLLDRVYELDRQLGDLDKHNEALKNDKDQAAKRADDFKRKADKLKAEVETRAQELSARDQVIAAADAARERALQEARADAEAERAEALERAVAEVRAEAAGEREAALEQAHVAAEAGRAEAVARRELELKKESEVRLSALYRANEEALGKQRAELEEALAEEQRAGAARLAQREAELETELGARNAELVAERATRQEREASIAAMDEALTEQGLELERLGSDLGGQTAEVGRLSSALAERSEELERAKAALAELDARVAVLDSTLTSANSELDRIRATLETEQEKLEAARRMSQDNAMSFERAKDALAAVLARIEEAETRSFE